MAKTKWTIQLDFNATKAQASELEEIAGNLDNLVKKDLEDCLNSIGSNWKGDNASAYIKKGQVVKGNIEDVAKKLRKAAETIRTIAQKTYDTEMKAIETVQNKG